MGGCTARHIVTNVVQGRRPHGMFTMQLPPEYASRDLLGGVHEMQDTGRGLLLTRYSVISIG